MFMLTSMKKIVVSSEKRDAASVLINRYYE